MDYEQLKEHIKSKKSALVAFSGGVDSSLLLAAAHDALGDQVLAVTVDSVLHPHQELEQARAIASRLGARHKVVVSDELSLAGFAENPVDRCYLCKHDRFARLVAMALDAGLEHVLEGSNTDDLGDYRPGMKAVKELEIESPFIDMGINKALIRDLAKERGLASWSKPSASCLAARIPYGLQITKERLERIDQAEQFLHSLGFEQVRARDHGKIVRIEVALKDIERLAAGDLRSRIVERLKDLGYTFVALDLDGYRSGSLNDGLT
jgi:pyridinium-3,5-biscarboxylic acid mononucleotide sulfurtransferase